MDHLQYNEGDLEIERSELESLLSRYEEKRARVIPADMSLKWIHIMVIS